MAKVEQLMEILKCSKAEALDIIKSDEAIDKGANPFPLSADQEKASKKARTTATGVYTFEKKERKADTDKREIISAIVEKIETLADEKTSYINNPEREIEFYYNAKKYKITLSAPRK
jgi:hypothetical protein